MTEPSTRAAHMEDATQQLVQNAFLRENLPSNHTLSGLERTKAAASFKPQTISRSSPRTACCL